MPDIGAFHPQVVHFVVALLFVGVITRLVSLTPLRTRFPFTRGMGITLIILGALATVVAAQSGDDAHEPVEQMPGARAAVQEHEDLGEWTRNIFLGAAALEIIGLALGGAPSRAKLALGLSIASVVVGLCGLVVLYEAAEHGGELVYGYAGGVGVRSGDTTDVRRLLTAALFNNARLDRTAGRKEDAARLFGELQRRVPNDLTVRLLSIESLMRDRNEPQAALTVLAALQIPPDSVRFQVRKGVLTAEAYVATGSVDSARAVLEALNAKHPNFYSVQQALKQLNKGR